MNTRQKRLWELYRLTEEEYEQILKFQGGVCAISKVPPKKQRLNVDHNHKTGQIRGLLSMRMNKGLGYFNDDPVLLRAAADYLESLPAVQALNKKVYGLIGQAKKKRVMLYGPLSEKTPKGKKK